MRTKHFIFLFAVITGITACKTDKSRHRPVTLKIPRFNGSSKNVDIRNTNEISSHTLITVKIGGEVVHPDTYQLPQGTTLLEAVKVAGEFTPFAFPKKIQVSQRGKIYALRLRQEVYGFKRRERAWYPDTHTPENDFRLEDGAIIYVGRAL